MTEGSLQLRILRYALLDPINDAREILRRLQNNEAFQHYLRKRVLRALPLVVGIVFTSLAFCAAALVFFLRAGALFALAGMIVVAPIVLIASFAVQAYVLLSWLEGRSLAKIQEHRRPRHHGPIGQWLVRSYRIDMGPLPQVPWIPGLVFFLLPAAMLAQVAASSAAWLAVFQIVAAIFYARRDPVPAIDHSPARGGVEALKSFAAGLLRKVRVSKPAGDLDFASHAARSGTGSRTWRLRSFVQSGFRFLRFLVELCLLNLLPFVEYCVLVAGIFFLVEGRRSAAERDVVLGILLVGVALLLAGLASIVTKRMSFRFYRSARTSYAGATALITGMMQVIVGGLAVATAYALATHVWQAKLDALLTNPWPLLIPLGLLLIGAGLLLVRRSSSYVGPLGTVLFILPKTLTGVAVLGAGASILVGWAWKIYDPQAFLSFVRLLPDEDMNLLANWWSAAIALLR
jgi:ABC-type multidrug transport system fused ATPase/permease subunit